MYSDIMYMERPKSKRSKMAVENRAKIFLPFSALRGFDIEIITKEKNRLLEEKVTLSEDQGEKIRNVLNQVQAGDIIELRYFVFVKQICGVNMGEYRKEKAVVCAVDSLLRRLVLDTFSVRFDDIRDITFH